MIKTISVTFNCCKKLNKQIIREEFEPNRGCSKNQSSENKGYRMPINDISFKLSVLL